MPEDTTDRATGLGQFTKTASDLDEQEQAAKIREQNAHVDLLAAQADAARGNEPRGNDTRPSGSNGLGEARRGLVVVDHLEAAGAARAYGFNGRETAGYILGFWQRHLRDAGDQGYYDKPEAERPPLEVQVVVLDEHLPAIAATMIRAGASVDVFNSLHEGVITLRVSTR